MDFAREGRKSIAPHPTQFTSPQLSDLKPETNIYYTLDMPGFIQNFRNCIQDICENVLLKASDFALLHLSTYQTTPSDFPGSS